MVEHHRSLADRLADDPGAAAPGCAAPAVAGLSRTLDNVAGVARWIGQVNRDLWGDLCRFGQRVAYWAVCEARTAMDRWDVAELAEFVDIWLDAEPTEARIEALVEALLQIDISRYAADDGRELLHDLRKTVAQLARARRREHESLIGMRRGASRITSILDAGSTVLHPVGTRSGRSLEDTVLEDLQPDVDPRIIEMINELGAQDRKIAMMKAATGCSWAAAATAAGAPALRGEALRRRLHRRRDALSTGRGSAVSGCSREIRSPAGSGRPTEARHRAYRPRHGDLAVTDIVTVVAMISAVGAAVRGVLMEARWWMALRGSMPAERPAIIRSLRGGDDAAREQPTQEASP